MFNKLIRMVAIFLVLIGVLLLGGSFLVSILFFIYEVIKTDNSFLIDIVNSLGVFVASFVGGMFIMVVGALLGNLTE